MRNGAGRIICDNYRLTLWTKLKFQLVQFLHRFGNTIKKQINNVFADGELTKENFLTNDCRVQT
jgi:hypothetical protein